MNRIILLTIFWSHSVSIGFAQAVSTPKVESSPAASAVTPPAVAAWPCFPPRLVAASREVLLGKEDLPKSVTSRAKLKNADWLTSRHVERYPRQLLPLNPAGAFP